MIKATFFLLMGVLLVPVNICKHMRLSRSYDQELRQKNNVGKRDFDSPCNSRLSSPRAYYDVESKTFVRYGKETPSKAFT